MNKLRRITSLTALLSAVFILLTSVVLYIVPQGRVAYWADWRLAGLTKTQWTNLHINLGVLFLLAVLLHVYLNWKPILSYLRTKTRKLRILTREFNIALGVTAVFLGGTYLEVPPFSTILDIGQSIKDRAAVQYGEPPYGHAELSSLRTLAQRMDWNLDESMARLAQAGLGAGDAEMTLEMLAEKYHTTPQHIYTAMQPPQQSAAEQLLPQDPPPGIGRLTLAEISKEYGFDMPKVLGAMEKHGKPAAADKPLKEIAASYNMAAPEFYAILKRITDDLD